MADIDLRDANAATTGVPGAFQQANTSYTFELDFALQSGVRAIGDVVELINLPQGFIAMGAAIETVEAGANAYTLALAVGSVDLIADGAQGADGTRRYSANGVTVAATSATVASNNLVLETLVAAPTDGKFIVTVTGVALHPRG